MFDSKEVKATSKKRAEVIIVELVDRRPSGFVLDGTRGTRNEHELDAPTARFIPNIGYRAELDTDGNPTGVYEEIRYIKNRKEISLEEQRRKNINPNRAAIEDKIIIKGGRFAVVNEGSTTGLYQYIIDAFYSESAKGRPEDLNAIYRVVIPGKEEEMFNEQEVMAADAIRLIATLYQKTGSEYVYNDEKINALCNLFQIFAETPSGKINGLMAIAKRNPENFLQKATKFEQTTVTEVTHAIELNVIKFDGNTVRYVLKDKVITNMGQGNFTHEKKIGKLADLLRTPDFKAAYEELKIELEAAREKAFKTANK